MPSSYMANMANMANVGNASNGSAGWLFPDRLNLPFVTEPDIGPKANPPQTVGDLPLIPVPHFPGRNWSAEWYPWLALVEFSATDWRAIDPAQLPDWPEGAPTTPPADWNNVPDLDIEGEVNDLVTAASNERPDALGEILAQSNEFVSTFLNAMGARPASHPQTTKVLAIASLVATLVAMHFKGLYTRPRPSQLRPALLPPIEVPGHASFPSGHSTQAHLMALCMGDVFADKPQHDTMLDVLWTLAGRIARNREIAGLHYRSDSTAGAALAGAIKGKLNSAAVPRYGAALSGAQGEWP